MIAFVALCLLLWIGALAVIAITTAHERAALEQLAVLEQQAADWDEPSRATVEAGWLDEVNELWWIFPAPEFKETPIFQQLRHEQDVRFAASVLADIDDLPEVSA